ncbi:hypothetical protein ColLi_00499 [Colletotrichum liriopes]|uniref:Uncharacterized protein n=1 Tax=Colletotrichum liriopes TaxID=708192 RepID=A0AA37GBZ9_9PEZI|nr:hypothetical protein ColLi_00499 [Colletotrichum liriopes]
MINPMSPRHSGWVGPDDRQKTYPRAAPCVPKEKYREGVAQYVLGLDAADRGARPWCETVMQDRRVRPSCKTVCQGGGTAG